MIPITSVPQTPNFVKGVINLRGTVIPVIDLRLRFGMEEIGYTERTCIIVIEIEGTDRILKVGIVVDAVSEVLSIDQEDIEEAPIFGSKLKTDFIPSKRSSIRFRCERYLAWKSAMQSCGPRSAASAAYCDATGEQIAIGMCAFSICFIQPF